MKEPINLQRKASCVQFSASLENRVHTTKTYCGDAKGHCHVNAHEERPVENSSGHHHLELKLTF